MKSIVLFRFHKKPLVVKQRIKLLREYNPGIEIYGLYGGKPELFKTMKKYLRKDFTHIYRLKPKYNGWDWLNGDLAMREWYINYGKNITFDRLYLIEWDALIFEPLSTAFAKVPQEGVGFSRLRSIIDEKSRWYWLNNQPWMGFYEELIERVNDKYSYKGNEMVCIFPLPVFPRSFIEDYSKIRIETTTYRKHGKKSRWENNVIPDFQKNMVLCHDEIRCPLYAEILGYKLYDNGFCPANKSDERKYFNSHPVIIEESVIYDELKKKDGRRVFHPYKKIFRDSKA